MIPVNPITQLVDHFGGQTKTAKALGVSQAAVSGWVTKNHGISPLTALRAEAVTGGRIRAVDLCPDLAALASPAA